jgi:hypothetical protein
MVHGPLPPAFPAAAPSLRPSLAALTALTAAVAQLTLHPWPGVALRCLSGSLGVCVLVGFLVGAEIWQIWKDEPTFFERVLLDLEKWDGLSKMANICGWCFNSWHSS